MATISSPCKLSSAFCQDPVTPSPLMSCCCFTRFSFLVWSEVACLSGVVCVSLASGQPPRRLTGNSLTPWASAWCPSSGMGDRETPPVTDKLAVGGQGDQWGWPLWAPSGMFYRPKGAVKWMFRVSNMRLHDDLISPHSWGQEAQFSEPPRELGQGPVSQQDVEASLTRWPPSASSSRALCGSHCLQHGTESAQVILELGGCETPHPTLHPGPQRSGSELGTATLALTSYGRVGSGPCRGTSAQHLCTAGSSPSPGTRRGGT